jgi:DNA repair protein RecO (recombination protein O)
MSLDRERNYRVEAIVIGRRDFREADRIVTLFSRELGKLSVIAKGSRKPTARSGPALEYFARGRFMLARGRDLDVVTSAELLERPAHLENDLTRLAYASHMAELTARLAQEGQELPLLYDLLVRSLRSLGNSTDDIATVRGFELAALALVGYQLDLWQCAGCQAELQAEVNFLGLRTGGVLCSNCRSSDGNTLSMSVHAQKYLRLLGRQGQEAGRQIAVNPALAVELERVMGSYVASVLERDLTSLRVLREIRESSPEFAV